MTPTTPNGTTGATTTPPVAVRKASQRNAILSLVDDDYIKQNANMPRSIWGDFSYLCSEESSARIRVNAMEVPGCNGPNSCQPSPDPTHPKDIPSDHNEGCLEWVRQATLGKWDQMHSFFEEVLEQSGNIEALRSWQLTSGLNAQAQAGRPSMNVQMPDFPQPTPPGQPKPRRSVFQKGG